MTHIDSLNTMKRAEHIQAELNELGAKILMNMPSKMPYSLPINYFDSLNDEITAAAKINDLLEPKQDWGYKMPFEAPGAAYFEGLSTQILAKVETETEPEWSKTNPFSVPQGYFESLPETIIAAIKSETPKAKKRIPLFRTVQLAASMALIIFAGFGVMKMNKATKITDKSNIAASLSEADIANYVNENLDDFDTDLIINSLAANDSKSNAKIEISDAEIKAYLNESGWN